ncbi:MAG: hypothetical protein AB1758_15455 [Candidatus Eremiobacterota bacterium]
MSTVAVLVLLAAGNLLGGAAPNTDQVRLDGWLGLQDPRIQSGDNLLVLRNHLPHQIPLGSVVLYSADYHNGEDRVYGELAATVRAVPGQHLSWKGDLSVDGEPEPVPNWFRVCLLKGPTHELTLQPGEYLLVPPVPVDVTDLQASIINRTQIRGLALRVLNPQGRRQNLRAR